MGVAPLAGLGRQQVDDRRHDPLGVGVGVVGDFSSTGRPDPDRDRRRVGDVEDVRQPGVAGPHLLGAPDARSGSTGAPVIAASRAAPHRPFSTGSKNAGPRGIVPCGMSATSSPACERRGRRLQRFVATRCPRSTRMPPMARGELPDDRGVEHLLLAEEADGPAAPWRA